MAGLASILHTPPPNATRSTLEATSRNQSPGATSNRAQRAKRKTSPASASQPTGDRLSKRLAQQRGQREEEEEEDPVFAAQPATTQEAKVEADPEDEDAAGALAFLIAAAEG